MNLRHRLQGWLWDRSPRLLPPLRRLKRSFSLLRYRWRSLIATLPARVVAGAPAPAAALGHPMLAVHCAAGDREAAERFLAAQTETSVALGAAAGATFFVSFKPPLAALPPTWLEAQLFAAVAERLLWTVSGWAVPAASPDGPIDVHLPVAAPVPGLVRLPTPEARGAPQVLGCAVAHLTTAERLEEGLKPVVLPAVGRSGPHFLREDVAAGRVVRQGTLVSLHDALRNLPPVPGPPTALFLLPFLAVGGAERLLLDLLAGLGERYRCLVVTLEPHREELGQTVDECRRHTPYVYTLGEWLPREAHLDALRHLVRRYRVEVLMSWNPTVLFFDAAAELRRLHPRLRLVNQLYNHEGGWIEHYGPRLVRSVEVHVAVNRRIGRALQEERGVPEERCAVIQHGVHVPELPPASERAERRRRARDELGLPQDACVVGSFMRLHPQKRPHDVLALARHLGERGEDDVHFLLAGGGPLDGEIDRELAARPLVNLTRLPLQRDVERLYDAVDLCLLPSAYEGLPVFLLEGLARARPCVATAVGDVPYLLRDGGGVAVESVGDVAALAAALAELRDPERRAAEGERGRRSVAERFGLERYVRAYEEVLFPAQAPQGDGS